MKEKSLMKISKIVIHTEKNFVQIKIIKKEFKLKQKVRDHDHYTGKYKGAAHSDCNLYYKIPREIPIIFHMDLDMIIIL